MAGDKPTFLDRRIEVRGLLSKPAAEQLDAMVKRAGVKSRGHLLDILLRSGADLDLLVEHQLAVDTSVLELW